MRCAPLSVLLALGFALTGLAVPISGKSRKAKEETKALTSTRDRDGRPLN